MRSGGVVFQAEHLVICLLVLLAGSSSGFAQEKPHTNDKHFEKIELQFSGFHLAAADDGSLIVAWHSGAGQRQILSFSAAGELLGNRKAPQSLHRVLVSGGKILGVGREGVTVLAPDLSVPGSIAPKSESNSRWSLIPRSRLSVGERLRFSLPDFRRLTMNVFISNPGGYLDGRTAFGLIEDGVLKSSVAGTPKLLIFPYGIRVAAKLRDEYVASSERWHPFPFFLSKIPAERPEQLTYSPHIAAALGAVESKGGWQLSSFQLDTGKPIASISLPKLSPGYRVSAITTSRDRVFVVAGPNLLSFDIQDFVDDKSRPFVIEPTQSTFLLNRDQPTAIRYSAQDASRYTLKLGPDAGLVWQPIELSSENGEFEVDAEKVLANALDELAAAVSRSIVGRELNNRELAIAYAEQAQQTYKELFGESPADMPIPIRASLIAEGPNLKTASLAHDFLVMVSLEEIEKALDKRSSYNRNPWAPTKGALNAEEGVASSPPSGGGSVDIEYARLWAESEARGDVAPTDLEKAAAAAKQIGDESIEGAFSQFVPSRIWTDRQGNQITAQLVSQFAGEFTLKDSRGKEHSVTEGQLSEADVDFLKQSASGRTRQGRAWREFLFAVQLGAIESYGKRHKGIRNFDLIDDLGQPRISWRVMILPELGYDELFKLFRFDQAWDSPHNSRLLKFMPIAFDVSGGETGSSKSKTSIQSLACNQSVMGTRSSTRSKLYGEQDATVLLLESSEGNAVHWTKPQDIALLQLKEAAEVLQSHEGMVRVGLLDGTSKMLPEDLGVEFWLRLGTYNDGLGFERLFGEIK